MTYPSNHMDTHNQTDSAAGTQSGLNWGGHIRIVKQHCHLEPPRITGAIWHWMHKDWQGGRIFHVSLHNYITLHDMNALIILVLQVRTFHTSLTAHKWHSLTCIRDPADAAAAAGCRTASKQGTTEKVINFQRPLLVLKSTELQFRVEAQQKMPEWLYKCQESSWRKEKN